MITSFHKIKTQSGISQKCKYQSLPGLNNQLNTDTFPSLAHTSICRKSKSISTSALTVSFWFFFLFSSKLVAGETPIFANGFDFSCSPSITETAQVLDFDSVITTDDGIYWVCPMTVVNVSGSNNKFYVSNRGEIIVNGQQNVLWAEDDTVSVLANSNEVNVAIYEIGTEIIDFVGTLSLMVCDDVVFEISTAPLPGC